MAEKARQKAIFLKQKHGCLTAVDLSRKGSIDEPIYDLVQFINCQENFVTTSSCSGRIAVFSYDSSSEIKKKGCKWLHITHDSCCAKNVMESLKKCQGDVFFKFEAFVLHVQCSALEYAQGMMAAAVASGFRNSGISVSNKGKIIAAIRSTHSLEVPLTHDGKVLVTDEYIEYLVELGNSKMKENLERIERFYNNLKKMISEESGLGDKRKLSGAAKRKKKMVKTSKKDSVSERNSLSDSKDDRETVFPDLDALIINTQGEERMKPGPLPTGFVSFNQVGHINFSARNENSKKDCEMIDKEKISDATESETTGKEHCFEGAETVKKGLSKAKSIDTEGLPGVIHNVTNVKECASHSKSMGERLDVKSNLLASKDNSQVFPHSAEICSSDKSDLLTTRKNKDSSVDITKQTCPMIFQNKTDSCISSIGKNRTIESAEIASDRKCMQKPPPLAVKGITGITIIPPHSSNDTEAMKKKITPCVEDIFQ